ncbi:hypothetical protein PZV05_000165 [Salmonella enterica]|nr:hypothetical protein [Salmonella enterica]ELF9247643.1 hypothetical protein [Salmonella enterica]
MPHTAGACEPLAGGERLHAAGVYAGNQTLDLWVNLKITFSHCFVFPDKTGMVADVDMLFHA